MPDIPGANWPSKVKPIRESLSPAHQLRLQSQRLDRIKSQLEDLQTQFSTLVGVIDTVMDRLYDVQTELEKSSEDK